jgi:hypothetical protein
MEALGGREGYTWTDHKTNTEIATELNTTPVLDKIQDYKRNWIKHVNQMPCKRLPRLVKSTPQKEDHRRDFWMRETGMGQQVAQLLGCYMIMMMMMMIKSPTSL